MAKSDIQKEAEAIMTITGALHALDEEARRRVIGYVMDHLGVETPAERDRKAYGDERPPEEEPSLVDIRAFKEDKQPKTDVQMAAVVAYYLAELAPDNLRKNEIATSDITEYFKQADYPLPRTPRVTLPNAKAGGYFDSAGHGKYRLNPVGHNLVAHNLPKSDADGAPRRHRTKKKTSRKSAKKKPKSRTSKKAG